MKTLANKFAEAQALAAEQNNVTKKEVQRWPFFVGPAETIRYERPGAVYGNQRPQTAGSVLRLRDGL